MSLKRNITDALGTKPLSERQLRNVTRADKKKLTKALQRLESEGKIRFNDGFWALSKNAAAFGASGNNVVEGTLVKLGRTFGFVQVQDELGDVFVPGHRLMAALPGDVVSLVVMPPKGAGKSREGEVVQVLRPSDRLVGSVEMWDSYLMLIPDNAQDTPLYIKKGTDAGAKPGEKVAAYVIERGERHEDIQVGIVRRFGSGDSASMCAKAILFAAGITKGFSEEVKAQAKAAAAQKITNDMVSTRVDLRSENIFTIDSSSTKDIDDAISVSRTEEGYRLGVHIADVSHYVRAKTLLDEEAFARGTSIYYADSVVPMLPKALSNGACSLNPNEDRLAFSCFMELSGDAKMLSYSFAKTVIRSKVKGVYSEINAIFEGDATPEIGQKYEGLLPSLELMREIYKKLAKHRLERGSLEIESDEPYLSIDENGKCVDVQKRTRKDAEKLIEEFMILANTAAAHFARQADIPFVYRVHDVPKADRVESLKSVLKALGIAYRFEGEVPTQQELSALLDVTRGTELEIPVHTAVLRSLAKAMYEPLPKGHYGLALRDYAHFTSPIRRYPDLAIHRILSDAVEGKPSAMLQKRYQNFAQQAGEHSSEREQTAQKIERDCDECYRAEYMKQFIGESFEGVISSVTAFGLYVVLPNTVEGMVHTSHLSKGRMELQEGVALRDALSGRVYRLGDSMEITVAGADISRGHVDFVPKGAEITSGEA